MDKNISEMKKTLNYKKCLQGFDLPKGFEHLRTTNEEIEELEKAIELQEMTRL